MATQQIEIILSRQMADCLSIPVFIVDTKGNLLFYNEPAEELLGLRFEETGFMPVEEWSVIFKPQNEKGELLPHVSLPLVQTLIHKIPSHGQFWVNNLKGEMHKISVTSYPIIGRPKRFIGAVALFWKSD
ncbi:MAG: PAS domain-containing protein [Bacteroidota bacterium]|nr:PAS domain-containing protein [Bacteroidota bacterium]